MAEIKKWCGVELREGERYRVTIEGAYTGPTFASDGGILGFATGEGRGNYVDGETVTAIEKVAPPIAVGDFVEWELHATDGSSGRVAGHVLAIASDYAMIESPFQARPVVVDVRLLRHG